MSPVYTSKPKRPQPSNAAPRRSARSTRTALAAAAALLFQCFGAAAAAPAAPAGHSVLLGGEAGAARTAARPAASTGKPVFARAANSAASPITVGKLVADGATTETLSLFLPVPEGDTDNDSSVVVEYRAAGASAWSQALDLYKNHHGAVAPFAGMIFGLRPDTAYEVRVTVQDPDGVNGAAQQTLKLRTRAVPPVVRALENNTVHVSNAAELKAAVEHALPGQVILLAPGRYVGMVHVLRRNGTPEAPITLRGADGFTSVISGDGAHWGLKIEESSYIHVENLVIRDAAIGVEIRDWSKTKRATAGNVLRHNHISHVVEGIVANSDGAGAVPHKDLYIVDNVLEGHNVYGDVSKATWNDEGIVVVAESSEIAYNTVSGFGDSLGFSRDQSRAVDFHHNYVKYGGDDGIELDFGNRNVAAHDNLFTNTGDGISFQYIVNGPAYAFRNLIYNVLPGRGPYKIKPEAECNDGVFLLNNTSVNAGRAFINYSACGSGFYFVNNLFTGDRTEQDIVRADSSRFNDLTWSHNAFIYDGYMQFSDLFKTSFAAFKDTERGAHDVLISKKTVFRNAPLLGKEAEGSLGPRRSVDGLDFRLASGSEAIGAAKVLPSITDGYAGRAPDIGAFQSNQGPTRYGARGISPVADTTVVPATAAAAAPTFEPPPTSTPKPAPHNEVARIDAIPAGQWAELRDTKMTAVVPKKYFDGPIRGITGPTSIMTAWGGAAFDTSRERLLVWGGGHADYAGNEVYAFDAGAAKWHRLTDASDPPAINTEAAPDGGPVSRHTYGSLAYLPNIDKMIGHGGARYRDAYNSVATWLFDLKTNTWARKTEEQRVAGHSGVMAYDKTTGTALQLLDVLMRYDPAKDHWTMLIQPSSGDTYGRYGAFDPKRNEFFYLGGKKAYLYDIGRKTHGEVTLSGDTTIRDKWYPGVVYVESADKYYAWSGGTSIYEITPGSWNVRVLPVAKGSSVPTEAVAAGTYGRFQFVPSKNAFIAVNGIGENVFAYKLGPSAGAASKGAGAAKAPRQTDG